LAAGNRWIEKRPSFTAPLGNADSEQDGEVVMMAGPDGVATTISGESAQPQAIDLDGDGRSEVLIIRVGSKGKGAVSLVHFGGRGYDR
jgi:hypothetical protein